MCNWESTYPDYIVDFKRIHIDKSWKLLFDNLMDDDKINKLQKSFSIVLKKISQVKNEKIYIYPNPNDIFNAFNLTKYDNLKVIILGQD